MERRSSLVRNSGPVPVVYFDGGDLPYIKLYPIADIHYDAETFDWNIFHKYLTILKEDEHAYTIILGDLLDAPQFLTSEPSSRMAINKAIEELLEHFAPVAHKIILVCSGNHDQRFLKKAGIDPIRLFAYSLGDIPYTDHQAIVHFGIGRNPKEKNRHRPFSYTCVATHGWGGGRTKGGRALKLSYYLNIWEGIDFFLMGHLHSYMEFPEGRFRYNPTNKTVSIVAPRLIMASSLLGYAKYASRKTLNPEAKVLCEIHLSGKEKRVKISSEVVS